MEERLTRHANCSKTEVAKMLLSNYLVFVWQLGGFPAQILSCCHSAQYGLRIGFPTRIPLETLEVLYATLTLGLMPHHFQVSAP